jgi:ubiquinone biosynthesis protein UbiJ
LPALAPAKLDAATLSNMAHRPVVVVSGDDAVLHRIAELLTKLSPSNLQLVEGIIRCVLVEQGNIAS